MISSLTPIAIPPSCSFSHSLSNCATVGYVHLSPTFPMRTTRHRSPYCAFNDDVALSRKMYLLSQRLKVVFGVTHSTFSGLACGYNESVPFKAFTCDNPAVRSHKLDDIIAILQVTIQVERVFHEPPFRQVDPSHFVVEVQDRLEPERTGDPMYDRVAALEQTVDVAEPLIVWINVPQTKSKRAAFCQELRVVN